MDKLPRLYLYSPIFLIVLLTRASLDPVFDLFKVGGMGLGALVNVFMLAVMFSVLSHYRFKLNKWTVLWVPLIIMLGVSLLYTPFAFRGFRAFLVIITYMAIFLVPFHFIKSKEHFIECIKLIIYSSFIPLVAVLYEFAFPEGSTNINGFRLFSTFNHPNVFAFYLVTIVSVCFFVIKSDLFVYETKFRKLCFFIMIFGLICILGTKTRSAWAVVALLILIYGVFKEKKYLLYLLVVSVIAFMIPSIQDRILNLFTGTDADDLLNNYETLNSYTWRKIIWGSAIEQFWERPFFGFGFESFTYYSGTFFVIESKDETGAGAHNTYVQLLFEIGIVGILCFLFLLVPILKRLWELRNKARENIIVFGLFVSYCLVHYSDNIFAYLVFNWYFWFFIGAFISYTNLKQTFVIKNQKPVAQ